MSLSDQGGRQADCTWGSWEGLMIFPCLSMTRYIGIPEMTLGWMNSRLSTNSADAPGNCGFSSDESKGCCSCTDWWHKHTHYILHMITTTYYHYKKKGWTTLEDLWFNPNSNQDCKPVTNRCCQNTDACRCDIKCYCNTTIKKLNETEQLLQWDFDFACDVSGSRSGSRPFDPPIGII